MVQLIADKRDIDFALYEQLNVESLLSYERYSEFNKKMFDMIISEAKNLGVKELLPTNAEGDKQGVMYENQKVITPECYKRAYRLLVEGEWTSMHEDPEYGGQGIPLIIEIAASEYIIGANFCLAAYGTLGHGTGKMIEIFGTDEQKRLFVKNLYTGKWGGTMLLTEPEAGSDVGALNTTAIRNEDGTYYLTGTKIFITNGDHDLTENIIHPVLARIEGAPKGTRGISLFIVPKIWVNPDGSLGEPNDIICTGIEEKMGQHGAATCSMALGSKGKCRALLLGEENRGLKVMFYMMNEARLAVGAQGAMQASAAYLYALDYAKKRIQGKEITEAFSDDADSVPIIRHPDVRRMLMEMKAYVEGMRSLIYYVCYCFDRMRCEKNDADREYFKSIIDMLTPVVKGYCSLKGTEVCDTAIQVFGGYGYIKEYPVEQLYRDIRVAQIYEGTNGIQAMDLLGRKLGMKDGKVFISLMGEMKKIAIRARENKDLEEFARQFEDAVDRLGETAMHLGLKAMGEEIRTAFSFAYPFMLATGDVAMAWMLLWRADTAVRALEGTKKRKDRLFYDGQIKTAQFFIETILPVTLGRMEAIKRCSNAAVIIDEKSFGG